jgi:histidinol-phosphate aminotransferase
VLEEEGAVAERVACSVEQRGRLTEGLEAIGLPVARSDANFVWLPICSEAEELTRYLRERGIAVRCFSGEGVRITTGTAADTAAVLAAVNNWRSSTSKR